MGETIYIVIGRFSPSGYSTENGAILGVFSTKELAQERIKRENYYKEIDIEEISIDYFNK